MLDSLPAISSEVMADTGYASDSFRERIWGMGPNRSSFPRNDGMRWLPAQNGPIGVDISLRNSRLASNNIAIS